MIGGREDEEEKDDCDDVEGEDEREDWKRIVNMVIVVNGYYQHDTDDD